MFAMRLLERLFQRSSFDEVHHNVPVIGIGEGIVHAWQADMPQPREIAHLSIVGIGGLDHFAWSQRIEVDLLNRYFRPVAVDILSLVDHAIAALACFAYDAIALRE